MAAVVFVGWGLSMAVFVACLCLRVARRPSCFNQKPRNYQSQAEYDCPHCPFEGRCKLVEWGR